MRKSRLGRFFLASSIVLSACFGVMTHSRAQDDGHGANWEAHLTLYGWGLSLDGTAKARGLSADVDVPFKTILDNLDGTVMGEARIYRDNFGVFFNGVYGSISADASGTVAGVPISVDASSRMTFLDAGVLYRTDPIALGGATGSGFQPTVVFEPLAGIRYTRISMDLGVNALNFDERYEFTDPIVGMRAIWRPLDRWKVVTHGDVGGFGVGSDFSWNVIGAVGYDFSLFGDQNASFLLGYRALGQDFKEGPLRREDAWDVITHGPLAGLSIRF